MPPASGITAFSSDSNERSNAQLRTLNNPPDHATLRNEPTVPIDVILLFALVIMSSLVFQNDGVSKPNVRVMGGELLAEQAVQRSLAHVG